MINNKKGISTIITTIIMIVLVLGAVGIIWAIVSQVLDEGVSDIGLGSKCLEINLVATAMNCDATNCDVTINRRAGGENFAGIKLIFSDVASQTPGNVVSIPNNIQELATIKTGNQIHGTGIAPDTVEIVAYFLDESGNEQICSNTKKFTF